MDQRVYETNHFAECIGFFWSALTELQRGTNYGLRKPVEILKTLVGQVDQGVTQSSIRSQHDDANAASAGLRDAGAWPSEADIFDLQATTLGVSESPSMDMSSYFVDQDLGIGDIEFDGMLEDELAGLFDPRQSRWWQE